MESTKLNSIKDNKKFDINAVEILYSLPEKSFTLINDEKNDIYLAKVKKFQNQSTDYNSEKYKKYIDKRKSNDKNSLLKSYDLFLNKKYNVILNQQTIERVKNFFK
jgi:peptidyl-prolyl cis-trans isomerase D